MIECEIANLKLNKKEKGKKKKRKRREKYMKTWNRKMERKKTLIKGG